jgi:hypothetical protein
MGFALNSLVALMRYKLPQEYKYAWLAEITFTLFMNLYQSLVFATLDIFKQ